MKKLAISLVAVVSAIIMCFAMAACTTKVAGKTYVYDSVEVSGTIPEGTTADEIKAGYEEMFKQLKATFNDDNTLKFEGFGDFEDDLTFIWKQDGKKVNIGMKIGEEEYWGDEVEGPSEFTVNGSKLVYENTAEGLTVKVTFKKA